MKIKKIIIKNENEDKNQHGNENEKQNENKTKMKIQMNFRFCFHFVSNFCFFFLQVSAFLSTPRDLEAPLMVNSLLIGLPVP